MIAFNLVMLILLEIPLLSFAIAPRWTVAGDRPSKGVGQPSRPSTRRYGAAVLSGLLMIKALIELLA